MRLITDKNWRGVKRERGILERIVRRGSVEAEELGLVPLIERPDMVIPWDEMKERIQEAHVKKTMPMHRWMADGVKPKSQGNTNFCWAYGAASAMELHRTLLNLPYRRLAPASMGWLVGWRNRGNYLLDTIQGITKRGMASSEFAPDGVYTSSRFKDGWEQNALEHRVEQWFDAGGSDKLMAQHVASMLVVGEPGYNAFNWWGHATCHAGVEWDEGELYNLRWTIVNSHGDGLIQLTGSRGIPDEVYFPLDITYSV